MLKGFKRKPIFSIGINDACYPIENCPYYSRWHSMLRRCYSKRYQERKPTYLGCTVCEEWLIFSNFKSWMEQQDWKGKQLDKDLLVKGNKIYSPSLCIFVSGKVNSYLAIHSKNKDELPLGVTENKRTQGRSFYAQGSNGSGEKLHLGTFKNPIDAHFCWMKNKIAVGNRLLSEEKDERVKTILLNLLDLLYSKLLNKLEVTKEDLTGR